MIIKTTSKMVNFIMPELGRKTLDFSTVVKMMKELQVPNYEFPLPYFWTGMIERRSKPDVFLKLWRLMVQLLDIGPILTSNAISSKLFNSFVKIIPSPYDNDKCTAVMLGARSGDSYQLMITMNTDTKDFIEIVAKSDVQIVIERSTYCHPMQLWPGTVNETEEGKDVEAMLLVVFMRSWNKMKEISAEFGLDLFDEAIDLWITSDEETLGIETLELHPLVPESLTRPA